MDDIIVVEGLHDEIRIKSVYPNANVVITNGSEVSKETIDLLKELSKKHQIIIFTDPDSPGERIRSIINDNIPYCKQAFLRKCDAISKNKKKVGIEHATKESIIESLEPVLSKEISKSETITSLELFELGLNGKKDSQVIRDKISNYLNIGKPNFKTFYKRLNLLGITKKELEDIICKIK